jgi:hypothetical protein
LFFVCWTTAFTAVDEKKMPAPVQPGIDAGQRKQEILACYDSGKSLTSVKVDCRPIS